MIRLFTAAALAALLAVPAWAQEVSPGTSSEQMQREQSSPLSEPSSPEESLRSSPQTGQTPTDCAPNDPRPECQTAQLPSTESPSASETPGTSSESQQWSPSQQQRAPDTPQGSGMGSSVPPGESSR